MPLRLLIFLTLGTTIIGGWHYYLWARLVRDTELPDPWRAVATAILIGMAVLMPVTMALGRVLGQSWRPVSLVAFTWMGLAFLLFFALLAGDAVRLVAWAAGFTRGAEEAIGDRRLLLSRLVGGAAALVGLGATATGVAAAFAPILERVRVPLARLPASLSGLRIVQISDVHVGTTINKEHISRLVDQMNALVPDVVVITGDLVDGSVSTLAEHVAPLARLTSKHGVFFVTGNHEYYSGAVEWVAHLATLGVRVLRNERVSIGDEHGSFDLAGVDDYSARGLAEGHGHDMNKAMADRDPTREVVLLAHQPRSIHEAAKHGVGLQLSGHTHGGQIFPWKFLVKLQQPFVAGLDRLGSTYIYTSRGTFFWGPPVRVGAPAEVTEITLLRA
jgi:hypothetical protein